MMVTIPVRSGVHRFRLAEAVYVRDRKLPAQHAGRQPVCRVNTRHSKFHAPAADKQGAAKDRVRTSLHDYTIAGRRSGYRI